MKIKELLSYELIATKQVTITPYSLITIVIIFFVTWLILWSLKRFLRMRVRTGKLDKPVAYSLNSLLKYLLYILAIVLSMDTIGLKVTILVAGSAALLVGIGLGLQQIFKDVVSGLFMHFERGVSVGDVVQVDDMVGRVQQINFRTSKIITRDNIAMILPNSKFIEGEVINWSDIDEKTRFHIDVGVAYGSDVRLVEKILIECVKEHTEIENEPPPFVRFQDFGNSSLDFSIYFWTRNSFFVENTKSDVRFSIDKRFREYEIQIPFPQRDVHIRSGKLS